MLFSIVIPVYNVEKYLNECMQSILLQVETIENDCEILLIDDGSTDTSGRICDTYKDRYPDIVKVFHKPNEGLLATRRFGFKRVSGDYVINCDSDDLLEKEMLKSVKNIILKYKNPDIIFINHNRYDGIEKTIEFENIFSNKHDSLIPRENVLREFMTGHSVVSVCGKICKTSCINPDLDYKKYGRMSTGEDTLQSVEFFTNADTFVYLNEALYDYRCDSGMTTKFDKDYYFTFKKIFEEIIKEKKAWNLKSFNKLFAIKVFQTTGRAITQSRYNKWNSYGEQRKYLKKIRQDKMFIVNIKYLNNIKENLQRDHYLLLYLLKVRFYLLIIIMLRMKNILDN